MKTSFFFFCLLLSAQLFSQTTERVEITGEINVPVNAEAAGITVYNMTSQNGTVTDANGIFTIEVAKNDSLSISAVQYQPFVVVVDQGVVENRRLEITVREAVTELEKVIVRPYDLSGNVRVDIQRAREPFQPDLDNVEKININRNLPPVENIAMNDPYVKNGIQFVNIFKAIFLSENDHGTKPIIREDIEVQIRKMYRDDFFKEYIDIKKENIDEFIFYAEKNGLSYALLKEGNELDLIEFLIAQGEKFKQQNK